MRTGLRLGEQIGLQWGDIDWNGQFLVVQRNIVRGVVTTPKSHQCRRVDLSAQLIGALLASRRVQQARWLKKGKEMPSWVFGDSYCCSSCAGVPPLRAEPSLVTDGNHRISARCANRRPQ